MPSSKREREYERRRYEKWQERQAAKRVARRRQRIIAGSVAAVLVLGIGVSTAVLLNRDDSDATAANSPAPTSTATAPAIGGEARTGNDGTVPDASLAEGRTWTGEITLNTGDVGIELDGKAAPQAVANFVTLAQEGYFDGTDCHRLTTDGLFVLQCGDPTATGTGGPGYTFGPVENAPADGIYPAGTIAMARSSAQDSQGSQFFIVYEDTELPTDGGGYTVFGKVTSGLDVIQAIADAGVVGGAADGQPTNRVTIEGVETQ
ncbi:peptidylprolyl isomerase [Cellulomonas taurus]|uniref:peptidylprolyl isomerase n=1 Tax=Cellulomonas taurus TaxID=2729175 RepID=UPI00145E09BB|nr:peptidylprolyl isomerase [Cellulomonas taurus]